MTCGQVIHLIHIGIIHPCSGILGILPFHSAGVLGPTAAGIGAPGVIGTTILGITAAGTGILGIMTVGVGDTTHPGIGILGTTGAGVILITDTTAATGMAEDSTLTMADTGTMWSGHPEPVL